MSCLSGHYFWVLDRHMSPSPARGITEVWGVPSPIDTVFTRCNCQGKTYIFRVKSLVWSNSCTGHIWMTVSRKWPIVSFVMSAGRPVLEIWKWCFGHWLSKARFSRLWWASGSGHSRSVRASVPEKERVRLLLQARWRSTVRSTKLKDHYCAFLNT